MRATIVLSIILLGLVGPNRLQANLSWKETTKEVVADPARSEVTLTFTFTNESKRPVTVSELVTSCGCTSASLERKIYAPGESGKIDVTVHYGGDIDRAEESVTIVTNGQPGERHTLRVKVSVPGARKKMERIEVSAQSVEWARGAKPIPKVITLQVTRSEDAIRPIAVSSKDKEFEVTLRQPTPDNHQLYELVVAPLRVDEPRQTVITITTNSRSFRPEWMPAITYQVSAAIK